MPKRNNSRNRHAKLVRIETDPQRAEFEPKPIGASTSQRTVEERTGPAPVSSSSDAHMSFFITRAQRVKLRKKGYSEDQIAQMKPAEAHKMLGLE
jgi:hypothetical protein